MQHYKLDIPWTYPQADDADKAEDVPCRLKVFSPCHPHDSHCHCSPGHKGHLMKKSVHVKLTDPVSQVSRTIVKPSCLVDQMKTPFGIFYSTQAYS